MPSTCLPAEWVHFDVHGNLRSHVLRCCTRRFSVCRCTYVNVRKTIRATCKTFIWVLTLTFFLKKCFFPLRILSELKISFHMALILFRRKNSNDSSSYFLSFFKHTSNGTRVKRRRMKFEIWENAFSVTKCQITHSRNKSLPASEAGTVSAVPVYFLL